MYKCEIRYSEEDVLRWHEKYQKIRSVVKVARFFNVYHETISTRFKKANLPIYKRRVDLYHDFFSQDTPESFYWAGFIAADGCVYNNKNSKYLSVWLQEKDSDHIDKLKKVLKVKNCNIKAQNHLCVCSDRIYDDLKRFNVVPRKTHIYTFPNWILEHKFSNHFMRGYVDGDGSFSVRVAKDSRNKMSFGICGTYGFINDFKYELSRRCDINPNIKPYKHKGKTIYSLCYCGNNNIIKIRNFLYKDSFSDIRMTRKYNLVYNDWIDERFRSHKCRPVCAINICDDSVVYFEAFCDILVHGFNDSLARNCIKGKQETHRGFIWRYATPEDIEKYKNSSNIY